MTAFTRYSLTRRNTNGQIAAGEVFTTPQRTIKVGMTLLIQNENGESQTTPITAIELMDGEFTIVTDSGSIYDVKII